MKLAAPKPRPISTLLPSTLLALGLLGACSPAPAPPDAVSATGVAEAMASPPPLSATAPPAPPTIGILAEPIEPVGPQQSGAVVLGRVQGAVLAFIADADDEAIVVVDLATLEERSRYELSGRPEHVLVGGHGELFASIASASRVTRLVMRGGKLARQSVADVAGEPTGMALTEDDRLLVASRWGGALTVLAADTLATERRVSLPRDPYAVTVLDDRRHALVTHVVGGTLSVVDLDDGSTRTLDAGRVDRKVVGGNMPMALPRGGRPGRRSAVDSVRADRRAVQAFAASKIGDGRVLVSAVLADGSRAAVGGGYGGGTTEIRTHAGVELLVEADASSVDVPMGTARDPHSDCFLPRASVFDAETGMLLVACAGTDRVAYVQARGPFRGVVKAAEVVPSGPTGVTLDPASRRWVSWSAFAGALSVGPLRPDHAEGDRTAVEVLRIPRRKPLPDAVARGRALFHQAGPARRVAADGRACASCHPSGRDDAVTWATPEGPRQTPILAGRIIGTAPYGWNGRMEKLSTHIDRTLERLRGIGVTRSLRSDLEAYLRAMPPPVDEPPAAADPVHADLVARGRALFTEGRRCSSCHPLDRQTTDGGTYDLGNHGHAELVRRFNTPTLRFVGQSAPYYHDGRYPTLAALLADPLTGMGTHADLVAGEHAALEAFLRTL